MKILAPLSGCLLLLACSDGGKSANPGQGGTTGGSAGSGGGAQAGATGSAGTTGGAGTSGSAGTMGGAGTNGAAGTTGAGGATGIGGQGGTGAQTCTDLENAYSQAILDVRMCIGNVPCAHLVTASLRCGCQTWVNDTTELDRIHAQWTAAGCTAVPCGILCAQTGTRSVCLINDSGDWCVPAT